MWSGSRDTLVYGNLIVNCERGIILGLGPQAGFEHSHTGGAVFNNVIYRAVGKTVHPDAGISIWDSPGTRVFNNTVIQNGTYPDAIEYRYPGTTGVQVFNNLTDGAIRSRNGAVATLGNNYTLATASLFVNAAAGDLHLAAGATAAIDRGRVMTGTTVDFDRNSRPAGSAWDIGADERTTQTPGPAAPAVYFPQNGQQNVATIAMTNGVTGTPIRWYAVSGATAYDVYFGATSTPPKVASLTVNGTSCTPEPCVSASVPGTIFFRPAAAPNTTYYWRIVARNASGSTSGPVWSFKTAP
jgi:hypothetical protein